MDVTGTADECFTNNPNVFRDASLIYIHHKMSNYLLPNIAPKSPAPPPSELPKLTSYILHIILTYTTGSGKPRSPTPNFTPPPPDLFRCRCPHPHLCLVPQYMSYHNRGVPTTNLVGPFRKRPLEPSLPPQS